jgi:hypothetical protein
VSTCAICGVVFFVAFVFPKTERAAARTEMATIDQSDIRGPEPHNYDPPISMSAKAPT